MVAANAERASEAELRSAIEQVHAAKRQLAEAEDNLRRVVDRLTSVTEPVPGRRVPYATILVTPRRRHAIRPDGRTFCDRRPTGEENLQNITADALEDVVTCEGCRARMAAEAERASEA